MVEWTRGHFEEVARVLKERTEKQGKKQPTVIPNTIMNIELCHDFADSFEEKNPRFDKDKFMSACIFK